MKQSKYLIIFMILSISSNLFSQTAGLFGKKNESLISLDGSYDSEKIEGGNQNTTSFGASYLIKGNLEVGASYQMSKVKSDDDSSLDFDINGLSFGGFYHIKESPTLPFNIKIGGMYGTAKASGGMIDLLDVSLEANATTFGGGVYKEISPNLIGFLDFGSISSKSIISGGGESESETDSYTSTSFGIAFRNGNVFIKPSIGQADGESSFNVTVGFLLPQ